MIACGIAEHIAKELSDFHVRQLFFLSFDVDPNSDISHDGIGDSLIKPLCFLIAGSQSNQCVNLLRLQVLPQGGEQLLCRAFMSAAF